MYLVDTSVWLEGLLEQEKTPEVRKFFNQLDPQLIHITDFALYSMAIALSRLKKHNPLGSDLHFKLNAYLHI